MTILIESNLFSDTRGIRGKHMARQNLTFWGYRGSKISMEANYTVGLYAYGGPMLKKCFKQF